MSLSIPSSFFPQHRAESAVLDMSGSNDPARADYNQVNLVTEGNGESPHFDSSDPLSYLPFNCRRRTAFCVTGGAILVTELFDSFAQRRQLQEWKRRIELRQMTWKEDDWRQSCYVPFVQSHLLDMNSQHLMLGMKGIELPDPDEQSITVLSTSIARLVPGDWSARPIIQDHHAAEIRKKQAKHLAKSQGATGHRQQAKADSTLSPLMGNCETTDIAQGHSDDGNGFENASNNAARVRPDSGGDRSDGESEPKRSRTNMSQVRSRVSGCREPLVVSAGQWSAHREVLITQSGPSNSSPCSSQAQGGTTPDVLLVFFTGLITACIALTIELKLCAARNEPTLPSKPSSASSRSSDLYCYRGRRTDLHKTDIEYTFREGCFKSIWYQKNLFEMTNGRDRLGIAQINEWFFRLCVIDSNTIILEVDDSLVKKQPNLRSRRSHTIEQLDCMRGESSIFRTPPGCLLKLDQSGALQIDSYGHALLSSAIYTGILVMALGRFHGESSHPAAAVQESDRPSSSRVESTLPVQRQHHTFDCPIEHRVQAKVDDGDARIALAKSDFYKGKRYPKSRFWSKTKDEAQTHAATAGLAAAAEDRASQSSAALLPPGTTSLSSTTPEIVFDQPAARGLGHFPAPPDHRDPAILSPLVTDGDTYAEESDHADPEPLVDGDEFNARFRRGSGSHTDDDDDDLRPTPSSNTLDFAAKTSRGQDPSLQQSKAHTADYTEAAGGRTKSAHRALSGSAIGVMASGHMLVRQGKGGNDCDSTQAEGEKMQGSRPALRTGDGRGASGPDVSDSNGYFGNDDDGNYESLDEPDDQQKDDCDDDGKDHDNHNHDRDETFRSHETDSDESSSSSEDGGQDRRGEVGNAKPFPAPLKPSQGTSVSTNAKASPPHRSFDRRNKRSRDADEASLWFGRDEAAQAGLKVVLITSSEFNLFQRRILDPVTYLPCPSDLDHLLNHRVDPDSPSTTFSFRVDTPPSPLNEFFHPLSQSLRRRTKSWHK